MPILLLCTGTVQAANTLTPASNTVSLSYQLPGTAGAAVTDAFTANATGTFFYVEGNTVPNWLTVTQAGTAGTTAVTTSGAADLISFQANAVAGTLVPGTYTASVVFQSSAATNPTATITVTLWVKEVAPTFSVAISTTTGSVTGSGTAQTANLTWGYGTASYPTLTISCTSSNDPISYAMTLSGTIGSSMSLNQPGGVAYTWGSAPTTLSFTPLTLLKAAVGSTLSGTVTVTPIIAGVSGTATVITVNVVINPAAVTVTSLSPAELPVATSGNATVVVNGSGFVTTTTVVKVSTDGTTFTTLDSSKVNVVNPNSMVLTLDAATWTATSQTLTFSFSDSGVTVTPVTATMGVTTAPIIYAVTNSGSYLPPAAASNPQVSAYELISIFGANFDSTGTSPIVNTLNGLGMYPTTVTNTASNAVTVSFMQGTAAGASTTDLGDAPLLFVSNNQINAIVPAAIAAQLGTGGATTANAANIVVNVASVGSNDPTLNPFNVDAVAATPGIFTPSGSGRGAGAILNSDWSLNTLTNPATHGTAVHIYATGLGNPPSTAKDDGTVTSAVYPTSCIATAEYLKVLNGTTPPPTTPLGGTAGSALPSGTLTAIDGAVLETADIYNNVYAPCFPVASSTGVQVKFGTVTTAVAASYAGFVMGSVAGLYQIDVTLPSSFTPAPVPSTGGPVAVYIVDGIGTSVVSSQGGVTIYVK